MSTQQANPHIEDFHVQQQLRDNLRLELTESIAGTDAVLEVEPERMQVLFHVPGIDTPRHVICNQAVQWAERNGYHVTWMPVMINAEFRDYDKLMAKYNQQPQVKVAG